MPLNRLSLQAMARLADDIDAVRAAMAILEDRGLVALASLEPGRHMTITLVREMPASAYQPDPLPADLATWPVHLNVPDHDPDKYARAAGLIDTKGVAVPAEPTPITAEAPPSGADSAADAGGQAAPEPAVTGAGGADRPAAPAPTPMWPRWTDAEVERLIDLVARSMEFDGLALRPAAMAVAPQLGRPPEGTAYKARSLVERIEARRRELVVGMLPEGVTEAGQEIPAGPPDDLPQEAGSPDARQASEGPEVAEGDAKAPDDATAPAPQPSAATIQEPPGPAVPLTPFGEMLAYLQGLPRRRGWTVQRDHDLLHFAQLGWKTGEIALELAILADEIKPRFAMLTRQGQYKRAEVLDGLAALLAAAVPDAAASPTAA
jgi:hypothetical protein